MLKQLLKYEFKATGRTYGGLYLALVALAVLSGFSLRSSSKDNFASLLLFAYMVVAVAVAVVSVMTIVTRFTRNLLGREGYLMHTLPVATWQLVISKFLCALAVTVLNGVVAVAAVVVLMPIRWSALLDGELWQMLLLDLRANPDVLLYLGELLVLILASLALLVAMVYLSMALGHLFRHRVLMSVVAFFALDIGGTVVIDLADTLGIPLLVKGEHLALWSGTLLMCLTAAAMLAVTSLLLRQRLNLE